MTALLEAAKQALEALRGYRREMQEHQPCDAERALEAALEQPEQEPVAWMMVNKTHNLGPSLHWKPQTDWHITWESVPLYTHPPRREWQVLTEDEIDSLWRKWVGTQRPNYSFTRAIETALKEKNHE